MYPLSNANILGTMTQKKTSDFVAPRHEKSLFWQMDWQKCVCTLAISECKNCYLSSCKAYKYAQKWLRMLLMLATLSTRGKGLFVVLQLIGKKFWRSNDGRWIWD